MTRLAGWMAGTVRRAGGTLLSTKRRLAPEDIERGSRMYVLDGACSLSMIALQGGPFLAVFALGIGATKYEIGLLAAIALLSQVMQFPGMLLVNLFRYRRFIAVLAIGASRLLWIPVILIPVLFVDRGVGFLLHWLFLSAFVGAVGGPAWNSVVREMLPRRTMGRVVSQRLRVGMGLTLVLTLLGGWFIDWWGGRFPDGGLYAYSMVFLLGAFFGAGGLFALANFPEQTMVVPKRANLSGLVTRPVADANFRWLLFFIGLWSFAVNLAAPFFVVYMIERIEISISLIAALMVTSQVAYFGSIRLWGRLVDRYSSKTVMSVSGLFFLISVLAWSFTTMPERHMFTIPILVLIHMFSGVSLAGVTLASNNIGLKLSPRGLAHSYLTIFGVAGAVAGGVAAMTGGMIADFFSAHELSLAINWTMPAHDYSIRALHFKALDFLFLIAFAVGLVALNQLKRVKEKGEAEEKEVLEELGDQFALPFRSLSSVTGIRRLTNLPARMIFDLGREIVATAAGPKVVPTKARGRGRRFGARA